MAVTTAIRPGTTSPSTVHEKDLRTRVQTARTEWIVVKASAAISAVKGHALIWDDASAGTVNAVSGAAATKGEVAGIFPNLADGVTDIADGEYFLLARGGEVEARTNGGVAAGAALATAGTAGKLDDATVTDPTTIAWAKATIGSAGSVLVDVDLP